jgi:hypothetical protein
MLHLFVDGHMGHAIESGGSGVQARVQHTVRFTVYADLFRVEPPDIATRRRPLTRSAASGLVGRVTGRLGC